MTKRVRRIPMVLKGYGSKFYHAKWIHSHAPRRYTGRFIPFFGRGGEFWNWSPTEGISEAINDIDNVATNFWIVLRDFADDLQRLLGKTPFSEIEWRTAGKRLARCLTTKNRVRMAADFFTVFRQSRMGLGKDYATPTSRLRRGMNEQVSAYLSAIDALQEAHLRLQPVEIRNCDFEKFIRQYDHKRAFFYLDPTYLPEVRQSTGQYQHEMSKPDHKRLLRLLPTIQGKFLLSMYHCPLYDNWAKKHGFNFVEKQTTAASSVKKLKPKRVEVLWKNY